MPRTFLLYYPNGGLFKPGQPGRSISYFAVTLTEDGQVVDPKVPSLNERSRGAHDPGSGPLINRWVFADESDFHREGSSTQYPAYICCENEYRSKYSSTLNGEFCFDGRKFHNISLAKIDSNWHGFRVNYDYSAWKVHDGTVLPKKNKAYVRVYRRRENSSRDFNIAAFGGDEGAALSAAREFEDECYRRATLPYDAIGTREEVLTLYYYSDLIESWGSNPRFSARPTYWGDEVDLDIGNGRRLNRLVADAYINACSNLPDMSGMNNAVNAIQLVEAGLGALKAIISHDVSGLKEIPKIGDVWLAYRYSYGTTKSDLEEVASYLGRASDLLFTDRVRSNGTASLSLGDDDIVTARCSISLGVSALSRLKSTIERYGLQMDGYAMWDMVPYSFMADWFLDVGGALEYGRQKNFSRRVRTNDCWCSIERRWTNEFGFREIYYHRWKGQPDVSSTVYASHEASGATIVKRAADVLALLR